MSETSPVGVHLLPQALVQAIQTSWSSETAWKGCWTPEQPALKQCSATSLVVQDFIGGALLEAKVDSESHIWNLTPHGEIDLTRAQFGLWKPTRLARTNRTHELSFPNTAQRYEHLRRAVVERLGKRSSFQDSRLKGLSG